MISIIPAIDILDGKCVRLEQGDYRLKKVYEEDPVAAVKKFQDAGIRRLHVVDLDGARAKRVVNWHALERIAAKTDMIIDFGGGIKSEQDLKVVFDCGASMAVIGSVAVSDPDLFQEWLFAWGPEKIILAADVRERKIAISGWLDTTAIDLFDFLKEFRDIGVKQVLCTDISKDGMLEGSSIGLYKEILEKVPELQIIASGGVTSVDELYALDETGVAGAIIGKALYEGRITVEELKYFLQ
jgi:phosphoribosylformimino-5-aminoimidazole carboxamide ribotide isomerase